MARQTIEQSGRTVDDAVQAALRQLGLSRAQVEVEVVEEGRAGIGPIGHRPALVRVTPLGAVDAAEPEDSTGAASPLPRIDDYADPTELAPGERPGSRQGTRRRGRQRAAASESQTEAQPDHRQRSRPRQVVQPTGGRRGRRGTNRETQRSESPRQANRRRNAPRSAPREPLPPFELLADPDFEPNDDPKQFAVELLTDIVHQLGFDVEVVARDPQTPMDGLNHAFAVLDVKAVEGEDLGLLIGRHGSHVAALQYLVNVILSRAVEGNHPITVDVDGYRRRREVALVEMAQRAAAEVREYGEPVELNAMPAAERRIIHLQIQDDPELHTQSVGEGASRRVRVLYREDG